MLDHHSQVKLWCDCPFWPDDGMCRLRDCSVCECPDNEFPESFKKPHILSSEAFICQEGKPQATVDRTLDRKAFKGWTEIDNPWTNDDETDNGELYQIQRFSENIDYSAVWSLICFQSFFFICTS